MCRDSREEHLTHLYVTFYRLSRTYFTVNRCKSDTNQPEWDGCKRRVCRYQRGNQNRTNRRGTDNTMVKRKKSTITCNSV